MPLVEHWRCPLAAAQAAAAEGCLAGTRCGCLDRPTASAARITLAAGEFSRVFRAEFSDPLGSDRKLETPPPVVAGGVLEIPEVQAGRAQEAVPERHPAPHEVEIRPVVLHRWHGPAVPRPVTPFQ